jgi:site-specific recombinase XerD
LTAGEDITFGQVAPQRHQLLSLDELVALVDELPLAPGDGIYAGTARRQGARWLVPYLAGLPGESWQDRWQLSGLEAHTFAEARDELVRVAGGVGVRTASQSAVSGTLSALIALDVIRPSFAFFQTARQGTKALSRLLCWRHDPHPVLLDEMIATNQTKSQSARSLCKIMVHTGRPTDQITAQDLLTYREAVLAEHAQTVGLEHLWNCLTQVGVLDGTFRQALRPGKKTIEQLVDNHSIESEPVRNLFIAYLTYRSPAIDYSTLRGLVHELCSLFWRRIELIAPGIDTIHLPEDVATEWKEAVRWRVDRDGNHQARKGMFTTFTTVRGFYLDVIQLAADEPQRWGRWACRPPISDNEIKAYSKFRHQLRSRMHERTRVRAVKVTDLADAAERNYRHVHEMYDSARGTATCGRFSVDGAEWERVDGASHPLAHPTVARVLEDGALDTNRLDLVIEEEDAFWGFAVIEVLRHTGIRVEELRELTQLDLHEYEHRDPTIGKVLLLHVNPSKLDKERMVVVAPELAAVFAAMARRIRAAVGSTDAALPSLVAYDHLECEDSEPMPFLFQRTAGRGCKGITKPFVHTYIQRVLDKICRVAGLTDVDGSIIDFTAHDFRRVFATDAVAAGLPPHIIQKLLGHATLATTQSYAAIFPDDVIRNHRAFIDNRRQLRPSDEYRDVAPDEWDEFEEHFAKRKIAIGDCMRAYGTNCVHEYACEQCKLARPDPGAEPRLRRTREGLLEQIDEARERGWAGEVERLDYIVAGVDDKLAELDRNHRRVTWIDTPRRKPAAGPPLSVGSVDGSSAVPGSGPAMEGTGLDATHEQRR